MAVASAPAQSPTAAPPAFASLAARISELRRADSSLVISVAAVHRGRVLWEAGFGADAGSVFRLASVAKSITAIATLMLVERGTLQLDAPAERYLGRGSIRVLRGSADSITIRRLLNMTAGIPHLTRFYWADGPVPLGESEVMRRFAFTSFRPGEAFHYSNLSFGILQRVISTTSGMSFARFVEQEIFARVGMTHSGVLPTPALSREEVTAVMGSGPNVVALPVGGLEPEGGAGFRSSAHDLALLASALTGGTPRVLSDASLRTMWNFSEQSFYALGWWRALGRTETAVIADGAAAGNSATIEIVPERELAVIALANRGSGVTTSLTGPLVDGALQHVGAPPLAPTRQPDLPPVLRTGSFSAGDQWLGIWCGAVTVGDQQVPVALTVRSGTDVQLSVNRGTTVAGTGIRQNGVGTFQATFNTSLPGPELDGQPHTLQLYLRSDGAVLYGYAAAQSAAARPRYLLPFAVTLARTGC